MLGVDHWVGQGFSAGYGFDAIAIALLGKSHPFGVVLAALLFGFLRSGATRMQSMAGIPIDIISIIQGLVIIFVAAPAIIRWIYRIPVKPSERDRADARLGQIGATWLLKPSPKAHTTRSRITTGIVLLVIGLFIFLLFRLSPGRPPSSA